MGLQRFGMLQEQQHRLEVLEAAVAKWTELLSNLSADGVEDIKTDIEDLQSRVTALETSASAES